MHAPTRITGLLLWEKANAGATVSPASPLAFLLPVGIMEI